MTQIASPLAAKLVGSVPSDTARLNSRENLQAAGERFEAIFTKMMLGSMRKAKLADGLFESQALDQFRDMQDDKLAQNMATHAPIGIGKAMTEFLAKANGATNNPSPPGGGVSQGLTEGEGTVPGAGKASLAITQGNVK